MWKFRVKGTVKEVNGLNLTPLLCSIPTCCIPYLNLSLPFGQVSLKFCLSGQVLITELADDLLDLLYIRQVTMKSLYLPNNILDLLKQNRTTYGLHTLTYLTAKLWNSLPDNIRTSESLNESKRNIYSVTNVLILNILVNIYKH